MTFVRRFHHVAVKLAEADPAITFFVGREVDGRMSHR